MARQTLIQSQDRGTTHTDWLNSKHTFSFGHYRNPDRQHFRTLRVFNDDIVSGGGGFATHPHKDMEIITYVLAGALAHQDSLGSQQILRPGEVQRMSAGTGILHSEWNASATEAVHFLQIWILPKQTGDTPRYEQRTISTEPGSTLIISNDGRHDTLAIHQDCDIYRLALPADGSQTYQLLEKNAGYLHLIEGSAQVQLPDNTITTLQAGDALGIEEARAVQITATTPIHALFLHLS
jgi:redox-sensitive bicupin YhaK (pirin superfamily)